VLRGDLFPDWYGKGNELPMKGAIALSLCAIFLAITAHVLMMLRA
jgi:hypothetical protein